MKLKELRKNGKVLRSKGAAVSAAGRRALIDPAISVPVLTAGRSPTLRIAHRADFLPANIPSALAGSIKLGDTLIDRFSPVYGSWYPRGTAQFDFRQSRCAATFGSGWQLVRTDLDNFTPMLGFRIRATAQAAYMRVDFGQTGDNSAPRSILKVSIDGNSFHVDITQRSWSFIDVVLPGDGASNHEVEFSLDGVPPGQRRVFAVIQAVELYRSMLAFPTDVLEA